VSSLKEGGGYTQLELRAMHASSDGGASHAEPAKLFVEAAAGAPAPAPSASVASIDSDSEADGEGLLLAVWCWCLICQSRVYKRLLHLPLPFVPPAADLVFHRPALCRPGWHLRRPSWRRVCHHAPA
jgi:hypothetical protein